MTERIMSERRDTGAAAVVLESAAAELVLCRRFCGKREAPRVAVYCAVAVWLLLLHLLRDSGSSGRERADIYYATLGRQNGEFNSHETSLSRLFQYVINIVLKIYASF